MNRRIEEGELWVVGPAEFLGMMLAGKLPCHVSVMESLV